jgi:addiction module toxin, txe/yoeB family
MKYSIEFSKDVLRTLKKWKKSNPISYKKFYSVLEELEEHPRTGTGHPEALKGHHDMTYSRRISAHDRIIYCIDDDQVIVLVVAAEGHYDDK